MRYLLDTNVLSELRKPACDARLRQWFNSVDEEDTFLSVLVLGEIRRGVEQKRERDPAQALALDRWLGVIESRFSGRVLPVCASVADMWGRSGASSPISTVDGLLAATAHVHGLTLVTRDVKDVARTGVPVLDPFSLEGSRGVP